MTQDVPSPEAPAPPPAPALSPFAAVAGTFTRPGPTFEALVRRPTWWLPFGLAVVVVAASIFLMTPKIDSERSIREMFERRAARTGQSISDQQISEIAARQEGGVGRATAIGTPVAAVMLLLVALLLWGGARAFGAEARFAQVLSLWTHANLANVAGALIAIPVVASLEDASQTQLSIQRVFKSNLGAFLPEEVPTFVSSIASSVDIFSLGALVLLCIGMQRLPGLSKGAAIGVPVGLWAVYVLGKAALATVFLG